jgi:hypothetical protein
MLLGWSFAVRETAFDADLVVGICSLGFGRRCLGVVSWADVVRIPPLALRRSLKSGFADQLDDRA